MFYAISAERQEHTKPIAQAVMSGQGESDLSIPKVCPSSQNQHEPSLRLCYGQGLGKADSKHLAT